MLGSSFPGPSQGQCAFPNLASFRQWGKAVLPNTSCRRPFSNSVRRPQELLLRRCECGDAEERRFSNSRMVLTRKAWLATEVKLLVGLA